MGEWSKSLVYDSRDLLQQRHKRGQGSSWGSCDCPDGRRWLCGPGWCQGHSQVQIGLLLMRVWAAMATVGSVLTAAPESGGWRWWDSLR